VKAGNHSVYCVLRCKLIRKAKASLVHWNTCGWPLAEIVMNRTSCKMKMMSRQASLEVASLQNSPTVGRKAGKNPFVRMNSDSDLHIQPISQEEERVLETLDEIQLLHNISKAPQIINNQNAEANKKKKMLLVKQKSLNRTLSTSALRIKKKRPGFWQA